ncbi:MAG: VWA domain-containing protein [Bacteroidales bacterium]|jgi:Ca-activated chloride channel family protein|nr:VWA domain-containing protein [Bacteroidales bacterium]
MKKHLLIFLLNILFMLSLQAQTQGQAVPRIAPITRILFIFDASYSMTGMWGTKTKMEVAKSVLIPFIDSVSKIPNTELALRIYGNRSPVPPQDCGDTHLEVPFGKNNVIEILNKITNVTPRGTTPIAYSLELGAQDFPHDSTARNIVFLITDGIEACDGDPCAISRELQKKGAILRPFIIGVGSDIDFNKVFNCAGDVFTAYSQDEFLPILNAAMQKALMTTPLQVYLLDVYKKPTETDVPMTFFDAASGFAHYHFVHSVIRPGEPDILFLDPLVRYKIKVHTMPPVYSEEIDLDAGKHTIVKINAVQGFLELPRPLGFPHNIDCIVRQANDLHTLTTQRTGEKRKYIVGEYDLEVFTLPHTYFYGVRIKPGESTTLTIPQPGKVTFSRTQQGFGAIYLNRETDYEFVVNLEVAPKGNEVFLLQPGKYVVIWRNKNENDTEKSVTKYFEITSGGSVFITLK